MNPTRTFRLPNGQEILIRNRPEAIQFYRDIFEKHIYTSHGIVVKPNDVVFDVGANIGIFTLFLGRIPDLRIFAFEPAPDVYRTLRANTKRHNITAKCLNIGLGSQGGIKRFTYYPQSSGMSTFYGSPRHERESLDIVMRQSLRQGKGSRTDQMLEHMDELVTRRLENQSILSRIETPSTIIRRYRVPRIDLLKIDVQKSEADVLAGIEEAHWPLIRQIVVEVHDIGDRVRRLALMLSRRGFAVATVQDDLYTGSVHRNLYAVRHKLAA
jgi:FkbM family methyltransferase